MQDGAPYVAPARRAARPRHTRVLVAYGLYAVLVVVACIAYAIVTTDAERARVDSELATVTDLTAHTVATWFSERTRTAQVVRHRPDCVDLAETLRADPDDEEAAAAMLDVLVALRDTYEYGSVMLLDHQGVPVVSTSEEYEEAWAMRLHEAMDACQVEYIDLHSHGGGAPHMVWLAHIAHDSASPVYGAIALETTPDSFLIPLLENTPLDWQTGALSLFAVEDGNAMVLAHEQPDARTHLIRRPLSESPALAEVVKLADSRDDRVVEAVDFRGTEVRAAGRLIEGTPWYLFTRVDTAELDRHLFRQSWTVIAVCLLLLLFPLLLVLHLFSGWTREEIQHAYRSELEAANEELMHANAARADFIAGMSHELRTPLNSIIGFSHILLDELPGELNEEQRRQLTMVNVAGAHLLSLINDVLDLSKIEAAADDLEVESVDVAELAAAVVATLQPQAKDSGLYIRVATPLHQCMISTDRRRAYQVLLNLAGNAIKFTNEGGVTVTVEPSGDMVRFTVADTGIGIDAGDLRHVFEDFYQVIGGGRGKPSGTGLGLALSRRIAETLGGSLEATSNPGTGSEFVLSLPFDPPPGFSVDEPAP